MINKQKFRILTALLLLRGVSVPRGVLVVAVVAPAEAGDVALHLVMPGPESGGRGVLDQSL